MNKPEVSMTMGSITISPPGAFPQYRVHLTFDSLAVACMMYTAIEEGNVGVEVEVPQTQFIIYELGDQK